MSFFSVTAVSDFCMFVCGNGPLRTFSDRDVCF
jgi:hypothetical protein